MPTRTFARPTLVLAFVCLGLLNAAVVQADAPQLMATMTPVKVDPFAEPWPTGDGTARIWLGSDTGVVCFELRVSNIPGFPPPISGNPDTFFAQIIPHRGGTAVFLLAAPISEAVTTGCVSGVSGAVISELFTNPQNFDVQFAEGNADAAGCGSNGVPCIFGAIRGQLLFAANAVAGSPPPQVPNTAIEPRSTSEPRIESGILVMIGVACLAIGSAAWVLSRRMRRPLN